MSQSAGIQDLTFKADADLSSAQFYFMCLDADGKASACGANGVSVGILQNKPDAEDKAALVRVSGTSKLWMSATNNEGALITPADAGSKEGEGEATTTCLDFIGAIALEAATADNDIIEVLITRFIFTDVAT